jgi:hypothetical protein
MTSGFDAKDMNNDITYYISEKKKVLVINGINLNPNNKATGGIKRFKKIEYHRKIPKAGCKFYLN